MSESTIHVALDLELTHDAATKLASRLTGDDFDVVLCVEKLLVALLDVEDSAVQVGIDAGELEAGINVLAIEQGLALDGVPPRPVRGPSAFALADLLRRLVHR